MTEEDRKRGSSGTIRQTCPGHVARGRVRGETTAPPAKGSQEHLGAFRGSRKPLETGKVLGEGSKTYSIYVLGLSILIQSVWFLHHHGGGRVESLVKIRCEGILGTCTRGWAANVRSRTP